VNTYGGMAKLRVRIEWRGEVWDKEATGGKFSGRKGGLHNDTGETS